MLCHVVQDPNAIEREGRCGPQALRVNLRVTITSWLNLDEKPGVPGRSSPKASEVWWRRRESNPINAIPQVMMAKDFW